MEKYKTRKIFTYSIFGGLLLPVLIGFLMLLSLFICQNSFVCLIVVASPLLPVGALLKIIALNNTGFLLLMFSFIFYFIVGYLIVFFILKRRNKK